MEKVYELAELPWDAPTESFRCPICGGELEFVEEVGHENNDGDYYTPNSYDIDYYVYCCQNCDEIINTKDEL